MKVSRVWIFVKSILPQQVLSIIYKLLWYSQLLTSSREYRFIMIIIFYEYILWELELEKNHAPKWCIPIFVDPLCVFVCQVQSRNTNESTANCSDMSDLVFLMAHWYWMHFSQSIFHRLKLWLGVLKLQTIESSQKTRKRAYYEITTIEKRKERISKNMRNDNKCAVG